MHIRFDTAPQTKRNRLIHIYNVCCFHHFKCSFAQLTFISLFFSAWFMLFILGFPFFFFWVELNKWFFDLFLWCNGNFAYYYWALNANGKRSRDFDAEFVFWMTISRFASWIASHSFACDMIWRIKSSTAGSEFKSNKSPNRSLLAAFNCCCNAACSSSPPPPSSCWLFSMDACWATLSIRLS